MVKPALAEQVSMRFVVRLVLFVVVGGALALVGYAIFSDLPAPQREVVLPIEAE